MEPGWGGLGAGIFQTRWAMLFKRQLEIARVSHLVIWHLGASYDTKLQYRDPSSFSGKPSSRVLTRRARLEELGISLEGPDGLPLVAFLVSLSQHIIRDGLVPVP